jgi:hypothetical protein
MIVLQETFLIATPELRRQIVERPERLTLSRPCIGCRPCRNQWKQISDRALLIYGKTDAVKVEIDTGGVPFRIASEVIQEDNGKKTKPTRIGINLAGTHAQGRVVLNVLPAAPN